MRSNLFSLNMQIQLQIHTYYLFWTVFLKLTMDSYILNRFTSQRFSLQEKNSIQDGLHPTN